MMRNPFVLAAMAAMALAASMRQASVDKYLAGEFSPSGASGHNKHSNHTVAMDKRAALKARNKRR